MRNYLFYTIISSTFFIACSNNKYESASVQKAKNIRCDTTTFLSGKQIFTVNCEGCHSLNFNMGGPLLRTYMDTNLNILDSFKLHNKMHVDISLGDTDLIKVQSYIFCTQCGRRV